MTTRRSSFTKTAALKYIRYYDQLLAQLKDPTRKPTGMFLSTNDFGGVKVSTLHNRFRDALNWLKSHNISPSEDKRADYEFLAAVMRVQDEAAGIRILLLSGPAPSTTVRPEETLKEQADWKEELEAWLSNPGSDFVKVFPNVRIFPENKEWLTKVIGACGGSYHLDGDKLTVALG
jgi:hypothetical protein